MATQTIPLKNPGHQVFQLESPMYRPMAHQLEQKDDPIRVAAVAFFDSDPVSPGAKIVNFQAFHIDYAFIGPSIQRSDGPANYVTITTIESLELMNRPTELVVNGHVIEDEDE